MNIFLNHFGCILPMNWLISLFKLRKKPQLREILESDFACNDVSVVSRGMWGTGMAIGQKPPPWIPSKDSLCYKKNPFENASPGIFYDFVAWVDNLSFPMQSTCHLSWALLWILHINGWKICLWIFLKVKISSMKHLCPILSDLQLLIW